MRIKRVKLTKNQPYSEDTLLIETDEGVINLVASELEEKLKTNLV